MGFHIRSSCHFWWFCFLSHYSDHTWIPWQKFTNTNLVGKVFQPCVSVQTRQPKHTMFPCSHQQKWVVVKRINQLTGSGIRVSSMAIPTLTNGDFRTIAACWKISLFWGFLALPRLTLQQSGRGFYLHKRGWNALPKLGLSPPTWKTSACLNWFIFPLFVGVKHAKKNKHNSPKRFEINQSRKLTVLIQEK